MAAEKKFFHQTRGFKVMIKGTRTRRKIYGKWVYKWKGQVSSQGGHVLWRGSFPTKPSFAAVIRAYEESLND
jgi:hypothetical protein